MEIKIKELPVYLKNVLINIILFPFWLISIYMYNREMYNTKDFLIIGSLCFCLTVMSSIIITFAFSDEKEEVIMLDQEAIIPSIAIQVIILSSLLFLGYIFKKVTGYYFEYYSFLSVYFGISLLLLYSIKFAGKNNLDKQNTSKTE